MSLIEQISQKRGVKYLQNILPGPIIFNSRDERFRNMPIQIRPGEAISLDEYPEDMLLKYEKIREAIKRGYIRPLTEEEYNVQKKQIDIQLKQKAMTEMAEEQVDSELIDPSKVSRSKHIHSVPNFPQDKYVKAYETYLKIDPNIDPVKFSDLVEKGYINIDAIVRDVEEVEVDQVTMSQSEATVVQAKDVGDVSTSTHHRFSMKPEVDNDVTQNLPRNLPGGIRLNAEDVEVVDLSEEVTESSPQVDMHNTTHGTPKKPIRRVEKS